MYQNHLTYTNLYHIIFTQNKFWRFLRMESNASRVMCGTCLYWNGLREIIYGDKTKVVMFEEMGYCECLNSSKFKENRKRQLKCKCYENWIKNL